VGAFARVFRPILRGQLNRLSVSDLVYVGTARLVNALDKGSRGRLVYSSTHCPDSALCEPVNLLVSE
jgi:hypothetical protein